MQMGSEAGAAKTCVTWRSGERRGEGLSPLLLPQSRSPVPRGEEMQCAITLPLLVRLPLTR